MAELRERLKVIEHVSPPEQWHQILGRHPGSAPRSPSRARRAIIVVAALAIGLGATVIVTKAFGHLGTLPASTSWPAPIRTVQPKVPTATSKGCPVVGARTDVSPAVAVPGTTVSVTGPLYYRDEGGGFVSPSGETLQAWWGLSGANAHTVDNAAIGDGNGGAVTAVGDVHLLGLVEPNGGCSFTLRFRVPNVPAGGYPVGVMLTGGHIDTRYGGFGFTVLEPATRSFLSGADLVAALQDGGAGCTQSGYRLGVSSISTDARTCLVRGAGVTIYVFHPSELKTYLDLQTPSDLASSGVSWVRGPNWFVAMSSVDAAGEVHSVIGGTLLSGKATGAPGGVSVPLAAGLKLANAKATLKGSSLLLGSRISAPSSAVPAGIVIGQSPPAGILVPPHSRVDLTVSTGPAHTGQRPKLSQP